MQCVGQAEGNCFIRYLHDFVKIDKVINYKSVCLIVPRGRILRVQKYLDTVDMGLEVSVYK